METNTFQCNLNVDKYFRLRSDGCNFAVSFNSRLTLFNLKKNQHWNIFCLRKINKIKICLRSDECTRLNQWPGWAWQASSLNFTGPCSLFSQIWICHMNTKHCHNIVITLSSISWAWQASFLSSTGPCSLLTSFTHFAYEFSTGPFSPLPRYLC